MDVRQMKQLLAVHTYGGFVRAAESLGISQPALSRSIARLEDQLHITLFERSRTGAIATPLGLALIERAQELVTGAQRLARDMELIASGQSGEVRIGIGPGMRETMPELMLALTAEYPRLRLSMNIDARRTLLRGLREGRLDMIMIGEEPGSNDPDLVHVRLFADRLLAVAHPDHPLVARDGVTLDEFVAHPTASPFTRQVFAALDPQLQHVRRSDPPPTYISNDIATLIALIIERQVTYIGSERLLRPWLDEGTIRVIDLDWHGYMATNVVMTRAATHSPVIARCAALMKAALQADNAPQDAPAVRIPPPSAT